MPNLIVVFAGVVAPIRALAIISVEDWSVKPVIELTT
jgi:hypothetical protein